MLKTIGLILTIVGGILLVLGIIGIFGTDPVAGVNSWALAIIGIIFFPTGIGLLKNAEGRGY